MRKVKLLSIFLLTFFIGIINCYAQPKIYDRNTLPNYGVKKQIDVEKNYSDIMQAPAVDSSEKIYDFTDSISDIQEEKIILKINEFVKKNDMEFIILIDKNYYPDEIKNYCNNQFKMAHLEEHDSKHVKSFYDYNDFGTRYLDNSGIVLYQNNAGNPCDNYIYSNLFLYGDAEKYITREEVYKAMELVVPYINEKKYYEGISNMLDQLDSNIEENKINVPVKEKITVTKKIESPWKLIVFDFVLSLVIICILIKKNIMVKKETVAFNYVKRGSLKITNKRDRVII